MSSIYIAVLNGNNKLLRFLSLKDSHRLVVMLLDLGISP
jgi:hypothetical protein